MKEKKKMPLEDENNAVTPEERANEEAVSVNTDSQAHSSQPAGNKVMATHGFLKILSTIKRR